MNSAGTDPSGGPGGDASVRATFDTRPPLSSRPTISISRLFTTSTLCNRLLPELLKKTKYAKPPPPQFSDVASPLVGLRRTRYFSHRVLDMSIRTSLGGWESLNIFPGAVTAAAPGAVAAAPPHRAISASFILSRQFEL